MALLTRGLLRGLDERPVEAPLTDRDLSEHQDISVTHPFMLMELFIYLAFLVSIKVCERNG